MHRVHSRQEPPPRNWGTATHLPLFSSEVQNPTPPELGDRGTADHSTPGSGQDIPKVGRVERSEGPREREREKPRRVRARDTKGHATGVAKWDTR